MCIRDSYKSVATTLGLFFLWCIASWCLTSLYDGEGRFTDILKATAYALVPVTLIQCILIPLSYMLVLTEASFYTMLVNIGYVWMAFLLFTGTLVTDVYKRQALYRSASATVSSGERCSPYRSHVRKSGNSSLRRAAQS